MRCDTRTPSSYCNISAVSLSAGYDSKCFEGLFLVQTN